MIALITGVSRGIGRSLVEHCCNSTDFTKVIGISRNKTALFDLSELFDSFVALPFDLQNGDYNELLKQLKNETTHINCLVNNAGLLVNKPFEKWSSIDIQKVFDVNIIGPFKLLQTCMPLLQESKLAHVLNISSMGGVQGTAKFTGLSGYSASKGALNILTECLAEEYKESNVSFNTISLGAVQTEMLQEAFPGYSAPLQPDDMARFIKSMMLNASKIMNGKNIEASLSTP